jgi:hypothetical protein
MPIDKYTKFILTVIACGLLALVVQNATGPSGAQLAPGAPLPTTTPSNTESYVFKKIQFCDSRGCIEVFNVALKDLSEACIQAIRDRSKTAEP